jgi:hypothetical protein
MRTITSLVWLLFCTVLLCPPNSHAGTVILNNFGYVYETGGFPASAAGDVLTGLGVVTSASPAISCDVGVNELTWVMKDLVSDGYISPDGGRTIIVSYTGGTIGLNCDLQNDHDWGVSPPNATAPSTFDDGSQLLIGSFTQFVMIYDTVLQYGAFQGLVNFTSGTELVNLPSPNGLIFAGTIGPAIDPNIPGGYSLEAVGQIIAPALCTVRGNARTTGGTPVAGVTVDVVDGEGNTYSVLTDADGNYVFYDVAAGNIAVNVVVPLGYTPVTDTDVVGACQAGGTLVVDFVFEQSPLQDQPRTIGFWKHQVNSALIGKQNGVQVPVGELLTLFQSVHDRFDIYFDVFTPVATLEDLRTVLSSKDDRSMYARARGQFSAMLLNVVSGRMATWQTISADGATVSQAITYISHLLIDTDGKNDETAKNIADTLNNGGTIAAGVIPLGIIQIAYAPAVDDVTAPELIDNVRNFPNPSHSNATISYDLGREAPVTLAIYNVKGERVRVLIDGVIQNGTNNVEWNGKDLAGRDLASGVYFYRLEAGERSVTRRMIIIR